MTLSEAITVAVISGILTLFGTVLTVYAAHRKQQSEMKTEIALVQKDIEELTREVREHNNFARRMPVVEEQVSFLTQRIEKLEEQK